MPKIRYKKLTFLPKTLKLIEQANAIIAEYTAQGYDLTLRQLYYQFVARGLIANTQKEYKRLGSVVNDGRLAGLIDWHHITDRTRSLRSLACWESPRNIVEACAAQYRIDKWEDQPFRFEIWIEKDALAGVFQRVCHELQVPYFSCRGYNSQSEMWAAAQRLKAYTEGGQKPVILHFGDHDPSGLDMTRDIIGRLEMFSGGVKVERLALNMDQVEEYEPPPNPAKTTDARAAAYITEFGSESWELDALEPDVLAGLVREHIRDHLDEDLWEERCGREARERQDLAMVAGNWESVVMDLRENNEE